MKRASEIFDLGPFKGKQPRTETHAADGSALKAMCTCYPNNPELRQGCGHENECWVLGNARHANEAMRSGRRIETQERQPDPESPIGHAMRRLKSAGVPAEYLNDARRDFPSKAKSRIAAEAWWAGDKGQKPALVLCGDTGVAKSTTAAWAALQWATQWTWQGPSGGKQTAPVVWLGGLELQRIGGFDANAALMLDAAEATSLLVIDDAGREGNRPAIQALSDVVQSRCDKRRLTVISANTTGEAFRQRYGIPLADRLRACAVIPDLRGEKSLRAR